MQGFAMSMSLGITFGAMLLTAPSIARADCARANANAQAALEALHACEEVHAFLIAAALRAKAQRATNAASSEGCFEAPMTA